MKIGEKINIIKPEFDRVDGRVVTYYPNTAEEYEAIKSLDEYSLKKIGCQIWDKDDSKTHWLYPHEWYNHIPDGLEVINICEVKKVFEKGVTDDDKRFGCLAYGFIQGSNDSE